MPNSPVYLAVPAGSLTHLACLEDRRAATDRKALKDVRHDLPLQTASALPCFQFQAIPGLQTCPEDLPWRKLKPGLRLRSIAPEDRSC